MEVTQFDHLSIRDKESLVREKGQLIEAQDFYSFYVLLYFLDEHTFKVTYDFSGRVLDLQEDPDHDANDSVSETASFFPA